MLDTILIKIKKFIPQPVFNLFEPAYHFSLALLGAIIYRFPSRKIKIVVITGTKGKTTTAELVNSVLESAGFKTAVLGTLRFKVDKKNIPNLRKMTIPGRFFVQRFLRQSVEAGCDWAIIEMTSEATKQFRHLFLNFDAFIFTNLAPEHIESHGSYEKYRDAKVKIAKTLETSIKRPRTVIINSDDKEADHFLGVNVEEKRIYSLRDAEPITATESGSTIKFQGENIHINVPGIFNVYNALAAINFGRSQDIEMSKIKEGIESVREVRGRMQYVQEGQDFLVVVDYAHTPDSLRSAYSVFRNKRIIAILGNTGGGRDKWKRPTMAKIAEDMCDEIILTNEDPYDEKPEDIVEEMARGMINKKPIIIMDRREAIRYALTLARANDVIIITGKGTDPYIMEKNGKRTPWDDATVVKEELRELMKNYA